MWNRQIRVKHVKRAKGFLRIDFEEYSIVSCYILPNISIKEYKDSLDEIIKNIEHSKEIVILGDINAKR